MPLDSKYAKNLGLRVFLGLWMILFCIALVAIVMPVLNPNLRLYGLRDVSALLIPIVLPAMYLGRVLGSKIQVSGFAKSIWHQLIGGVAWSVLSTVWVFIVVFHEKVLASILGKGSAFDLGRVFTEGFSFGATTLAIVLIPSTILASGVLAAILGKRSHSSDV